MKEAVFEQVGADIETASSGAVLPYLFRATGQTVLFSGFMKAYTEGKDNPEEEFEDMEKILPELSKDEVLDLQKLLPEQHFTKPPPRYTEASLVKNWNRKESDVRVHTLLRFQQSLIAAILLKIKNNWCRPIPQKL